MKIIEALKELPLIEKKIGKLQREIAEYSSFLSRGEGSRPPFGDNTTQQQEVMSRLQAVGDLTTRKAKLRRVLAMTNAQTDVTISGKTMSITEWIEMREHGIRNNLRALEYLTEDKARNELRSLSGDAALNTSIVRFFDEAKKVELTNLNQEIHDKIDSTLEMVNATTDLVEEI